MPGEREFLGSAGIDGPGGIYPGPGPNKYRFMGVEGGDHMLNPLKIDCYRGMDLCDDRNFLEQESTDEGFEYFDVQDLENLGIPDHEDFCEWPSGLDDVKLKYLCLSSRNFDIPLEWLSDEHDGRSFIEGAYFLAEKLPLLGRLAQMYRTRMWSRDTVMRALRVYNIQVDELVRIDGNSFYSLRAMMSTENTEYEWEIGIEKDDMLMLVDKIWGRFVAKG